MTLVTTLVLGLGYPLLVTVLAQSLFPHQANGLDETGQQVGAGLIGQPFSSPGYFWPRPSAAGRGYDAGASGGSNLGPTNRTLVERVRADVARLHATNPSVPVPVDLVTTSASGLDPHISPAAAAFQVARVARERGTDRSVVERLVREHTEERQWGLFGEPRVNVLQLNLALDRDYPVPAVSPGSGVNR
jgi:K+-transporting ATPase ATPase C chain